MIKLEGRLAGPWVAELAREWSAMSATRDGLKIIFDLRGLTYADDDGMQTLRTIYDQTHAQLLASTPWTRYLADEVTRLQQ